MKKNKYIFYYYQKNNRTAAYLVIRLSKNGIRGYICDYAAEESRFFEDILKFVIRKKYLDVISIYNLNLPPDIAEILTRTGFRSKGILRRFEKKIIGEWPLMIRPVKKDISATDWLIENLDVRHMGSWDIKEICSDSS